MAELTKELNRMLGIETTINSIPPTNRQADRMNEPRVGTVLEILYRV